MAKVNEGLLIAGTVTGRVKRFVGVNATELVTYKLLAGGKEYYVKDWKPDGAYFNVGDAVTAPVAVKVYQKNGSASIDYAFTKGSPLFGEEF